MGHLAGMGLFDQPFGMIVRDYSQLLGGNWPSEQLAAMNVFCERVWGSFSSQGVSWVGFYVAENESEMVLVARRNKPACSPIGMHGACGRGLVSKKPLVVRDVKALGAGYIACDPRDQAEVVIPLIDASGRAWAVLDVDSFEVGAFGVEDALGFNAVLLEAGLQFVTFERLDVCAA